MRLFPLAFRSLGHVWSGPAAELFQDGVRALDGRFGEMADAHREAERALRTYADALERAQQTARRAEEDAARAIEDKRTAVCSRDDAEHDKTRARVGIVAAEVDRQTALVTQTATTVLVPGLAPLTDGAADEARARRDRWEALESDARSRERAAEKAIDSAEQRLDDARSLAEQARKDRLDAAKDLVKVLQDNAPRAAGKSVWTVGPLAATKSTLNGLNTAGEQLGRTPKPDPRFPDAGKDTTGRTPDATGPGKITTPEKATAPEAPNGAGKWLKRVGPIGDAIGGATAGSEQEAKDRDRFDISEGEKDARARGTAVANTLFGGLSSAATGAAAGAVVGSVVPGPGTAIGAVAGGILSFGFSGVVDHFDGPLEKRVNAAGAATGGAIYNAVDGVAERVNDAASNFGREAADTTGAVFDEIGKRWPWK
jgi:uncharacterized protein YukE/type II secretory pathway pseudopilin PulG